MGDSASEKKLLARIQGKKKWEMIYAFMPGMLLPSSSVPSKMLNLAVWDCFGVSSLGRKCRHKVFGCMLGPCCKNNNQASHWLSWTVGVDFNGEIIRAVFLSLLVGSRVRKPTAFDQDIWFRWNYVSVYPHLAKALYQPADPCKKIRIEICRSTFPNYIKFVDRRIFRVKKLWKGRPEW